MIRAFDGFGDPVRRLPAKIVAPSRSSGADGGAYRAEAGRRNGLASANVRFRPIADIRFGTLLRYLRRHLASFLRRFIKAEAKGGMVLRLDGETVVVADDLRGCRGERLTGESHKFRRC